MLSARQPGGVLRERSRHRRCRASERLITPGVARLGAIVVEPTTTPRVASAPPVAVMLPAIVAADAGDRCGREVVVTVGATTAAAVVKSTLPPYVVPSVGGVGLEVVQRPLAVNPVAFLEKGPVPMCRLRQIEDAGRRQFGDAVVDADYDATYRRCGCARVGDVAGQGRRRRVIAVAGEVVTTIGGSTTEAAAANASTSPNPLGWATSHRYCS